MPTPLTQPIRIQYAGEEIYIHEPGCECGLDHQNKLVADAKAAVLTLFDHRADHRYYQVWYRTGKWNLHEAIEMLLERRKNGRQKSA